MHKNANKYYELKNRYQNLLYKISFDILNNRIRAERVVIKTLESLSRHLGTFDTVESYKTAYLAVLLAKDTAREELEDAGDIEEQFDSFSQDDEFDFYEVDTYSIIRALEDLPEKQSFYLVLRHEYGFDDNGMADLLNTHPANIRSELCRATDALNTAINQMALSGAQKQENAKDKVLSVLPSFVNNLGASYSAIQCEDAGFSEEYDSVAVYTPPAPKRRENEHINYVGGVVYIIIAALFALMIHINPDLFTDIGLVKPESKSSSTSKITSVATTSKPFVFTPKKPDYTPTGYTIREEKTTDDTYYIHYAYYNFNNITLTQKVYDPNINEQAKKHNPKYLRDYPQEDTVYYNDGEKSVVFFHYEGYTFIITSESSDLYHVKQLAQSIVKKEEGYWWRYE